MSRRLRKRRSPHVLREDVPRHRAKGAAYAITDDWRREVEEKRIEKGWSRSKLAEEAGIAPSVLTEMLEIGSKQRTSRHVPRVHKALGMPAPKPLTATSLDPVRHEIDTGLDTLDQEGLRAVLAVIQRMRPDRK